MNALVEGDRLPALLLAAGGVGGAMLAATSATLPAAFWTAAPERSLPLIAQHALIWRIANVGFILAAVLTVAGLELLPGTVGARGAALAHAAAITFALGSALWLVTLAIRLFVTPAAASDYLATGAVDPAFATIARATFGLFATFIVVAGSALIALGVAMLLGGSVPAFAGWVTLVTGVIVVSGQLALGDMLPVVVYLPTTVVGFVLLLT